MRDARTWAALLLLLSVPATLPAAAVENWPQWRGPGGQGVSADTEVPTEWAPDKNVLWKAELPGTGMSSPIVWGDRIYLTAVLEGDVVPGQRAVQTPAGPGGGLDPPRRDRQVAGDGEASRPLLRLGLLPFNPAVHQTTRFRLR